MTKATGLAPTTRPMALAAICNKAGDLGPKFSIIPPFKTAGRRFGAL